MTHCRDLDEVRHNIDALDREIVPLLVRRAAFVHQAASFKETEAAVVVPERIEAIVGKVRRQAADLGADPDLMERIYRQMMDAYIAFEARRWREINPGA